MLSILCWPISFIVEKIYSIRRQLYKNNVLHSYELDKPVISIGNISLGGSGKTPFIIDLVKFIESKGKKALILTRGYKSYYEFTSFLTHQGDDADLSELGDEALLMRKAFKSSILIGKKRYSNYVSQLTKRNFDIVILDDGFQHLGIRRDLDIVLIDATLDKDKFHVVPSGYLREGKSALTDADYKILTKVNLASSKNLDFYSHFNVDAELKLETQGYFDVNDEIVELIPGTKVIVISSIAKPEAFIDGLVKDSLIIQDHFKLRDHEQMSSEKLNQISERAHNKSLKIICTEKDIVKLRKISKCDNIFYKKVHFQFDKFESLLKDIFNV